MNKGKFIGVLLCGLMATASAFAKEIASGNSLLPEGFDTSNFQLSKSENDANCKMKQQKVLSAEGLALKDNIKVEYGEGHGETIEEALKEAMKDVLQKVVGVYVDSDFRMNNDEIIKDEIITHSNGFIDHYKKIEESDDADGRGKAVTIKAWVKMRDFVNRMKKIAPSQTVEADGVQLDVDLSNTANAERLLKKELDGLNPAMDFLEVALVKDVRPVVIKTTDEAVTMRYVFQMHYSDSRYYEQFIPRISRALDQISETPPRDIAIAGNASEAKLYPLINDFNGNGCPKEDAVWKKCTVPGFCPRPKGLTKKARECVRILISYENGVPQLREWQLSQHLYSVYAGLCEQSTDRCRNLSCKLALADDKGGELAQGRHKVSRRWYLVGGPFAHYNRDILDFAPFIGPWNSEKSAIVKNRNRQNARDVWDDCWRYNEWFDKYVGCIDITIARKDVPKIKTAKVSLETNNEGENK